MRGAVSVALVYFYYDPDGGSVDGEKSTLIAMTLTVVLFSTLVFGAVTKPLLDFMLGPDRAGPHIPALCLDVYCDCLNLNVHPMFIPSFTCIVHRDALSGSQVPDTLPCSYVALRPRQRGLPKRFGTSDTFIPRTASGVTAASHHDVHGNEGMELALHGGEPGAHAALAIASGGYESDATAFSNGTCSDEEEDEVLSPDTAGLLSNAGAPAGARPAVA